jgi:hypothetical protein
VPGRKENLFAKYALTSIVGVRGAANMAYTLEEIEATARPDSNRHWILPGAVRTGTKILMTGADEPTLNLVAAELAVSATTYTRFMGTIPPWIAAATMYVTNDMYMTSTNIRRLLNGRGLEKSPEDLHIVPFDHYFQWLVQWGAPSAVTANLAVHNTAKLLVLDTTTLDEEHKNEVLTSTQRLADTGITTIICTTDPVNAAYTRVWKDITFVVEHDRLNQAVVFTTSSRESEAITKAHCVRAKHYIKFEPLPTCEYTKTELAVWQAVYRLGHATTASTREALGFKKSQTDLLRGAFDSLHKKGALTYEQQDTRVDHRRTKVWSVKLTEDK